MDLIKFVKKNYNEDDSEYFLTIYSIIRCIFRIIRDIEYVRYKSLSSIIISKDKLGDYYLSFSGKKKIKSKKVYKLFVNDLNALNINFHHDYLNEILSLNKSLRTILILLNLEIDHLRYNLLG